jgi:TolB-like protein
MRVLVALSILSLAAPALAAPRLKIAVMEVKNVQGVPDGTATILTDIVVSEVARYGIEVVSKSDIAAIVGFEKEKTLLGCSDDSNCLAEIGGALGVDYMLTGQVGQIGSRFRLSLILVDVKKGKVAARAADFCDKNEDALANASVQRVREIIAIVQAGQAGAEKPAIVAVPKAAPPPPPPPSPVAKAAAASPEPAQTSGGWSRRKLVGVSLTGSGVLFAGGGVFMGLRARRLDNELAAMSSDVGFYYDYPAKRDQVKRAALIADVLYGVGAIAAGTGGYLWFTDKRAPIAVMPYAAAGQAGLVAAGTF